MTSFCFLSFRQLAASVFVQAVRWRTILRRRMLWMISGTMVEGIGIRARLWGMSAIDSFVSKSNAIADERDYLRSTLIMRQ